MKRKTNYKQARDVFSKFTNWNSGSFFDFKNYFNFFN